MKEHEIQTAQQHAEVASLSVPLARPLFISSPVALLHCKATLAQSCCFRSELALSRYTTIFQLRIHVKMNKDFGYIVLQ